MYSHSTFSKAHKNSTCLSDPWSYSCWTAVRHHPAPSCTAHHSICLSNFTTCVGRFIPQQYTNLTQPSVKKKSYLSTVGLSSFVPSLSLLLLPGEITIEMWSDFFALLVHQIDGRSLLRALLRLAALGRTASSRVAEDCADPIEGLLLLRGYYRYWWKETAYLLFQLADPV